MTHDEINDKFIQDELAHLALLQLLMKLNITSAREELNLKVLRIELKLLRQAIKSATANVKKTTQQIKENNSQLKQFTNLLHETHIDLVHIGKELDE